MPNVLLQNLKDSSSVVPKALPRNSVKTPFFSYFIQSACQQTLTHQIKHNKSKQTYA